MSLPEELQLLRSDSRMAIVRTVRTTPGISRATLANHLGITRPAVGQLVEALIAEGWLEEQLPGNSVTRGRPGRPIVLSTRRFAFLGASVNEERNQVVATTLDGEVLQMSVRDYPTSNMGDALASLAGHIREMHDTLATKGYRIGGIGLGAPGPIFPGSGVLRFSERTGWVDAPIRDQLSEQLRQLALPALPIVAERGVGCIALHQFNMERTREAEPLLYLQIGHSIASAVAGRAGLYRSAHGLAGTISHMQVVPDGPECKCGRRGCANVTVTLAAIEREVGMKISDIVDAGELDSTRVRAAYDRAGYLLGSLIRNLCLVYDPTRVFVGGPAIYVSSRLIDVAQQTLNELCVPVTMPAPRIEVVRFEKDAVARGAAVALIDAIVGGRS